MGVKTIRAENIYNKIITISAITSLLTMKSMRPDEKSVASLTGSYGYISIVSNNVTTKSQTGYLMKNARVSFHIICKKDLSGTETPERVLGNIIDAITNNIVYQGCGSKISNIDGFIIQSIMEDAVSPIFFEDNKYYIVKDYLFNYISVE